MHFPGKTWTPHYIRWTAHGVIGEDMVRTPAKHRKADRLHKIAALRDRPGFDGERRAAEAALERIAAKPQRKAAKRYQLDAAFIRRLPKPDKGNRIYYDTEVIGLGVRITAQGHLAFVFNYRTRGGREGRYTIGACSDWSCSGARAEVKRLRHKVDQGGDPQLDVRELREAPTVADLIKRFETEHLVRRRASTAADYRSMIRIHIAPHFGEKTKVADVTFDDIDRLHRKITAAGHKRRANTVVAVLSKMFALAVRWGMRSDNPCKGVEKNTETTRKRYMSGDELLRLTKALAGYPDKQTANVVRVLLLTGCRRGEALSMRWADVDPTTGTWSKPASSVKQNEDHIVPLSAPARQLLSEISAQQIKTSKRRQLGEFVFPGAGKTEHVVELKRTWRRLCRSAGITGLRLHDLRHSFASQLASGGASLPLIGALLGHSNPSTTQRYAHLFDDPQRAAVERVGAVITAAGTPAKEATPIKRRGV